MSEEIPKGTRTILLVDDEDAILNDGRDILSSLGYIVFVAKGGKDAVRIYKKNKGKIDLVILDMIMPGMDCMDTFKAMREINPDLKVMISSGCIMDYKVDETTEKGFEGFIQKPFRLKELSRKIREILDKKIVRA